MDLLQNSNHVESQLYRSIVTINQVLCRQSRRSLIPGERDHKVGECVVMDGLCVDLSIQLVDQPLLSPKMALLSSKTTRSSRGFIFNPVLCFLFSKFKLVGCSCGLRIKTHLSFLFFGFSVLSLEALHVPAGLGFTDCA